MSNTKDLFQDLTPDARVQALKDAAYTTQNEIVRRNYTAAQIERMKNELSDETIIKLDCEEELKKVSKPLKDQIKEHAEVIKNTSREIRRGWFENDEEVFVIQDVQNQEMVHYDRNGKWLYARPMTQQERQLHLKIA